VTAQASRRHWRIGQKDACKVFHLYYENTMEAQAIALVSEKAAAAALLSGDADGGGLAQLAGGPRSLEAELARSIGAEMPVVDATQLFRQQARASADFTSGWATGEKTDDTALAAVVPPENVIGRRFLLGGETHEIADYGPLTEASYLVRATRTDRARLLPAEQVLTYLKAQPLSSDDAASMGLPLLVPLEKAMTATPSHSQRPHRQLPPVPPPAVSRPGVAANPPNPALRPYQAVLAAKQKHPQALILVRLGNFYEAFNQDAELLARTLDIVLTSRNLTPDQRVAMAGIPVHALETYAARLTAQGLTLAVLEDRTPTAASAPATPPEAPHPSGEALRKAHDAYQTLKTRFPKALILIDRGTRYAAFGDDARQLTALLHLGSPLQTRDLPPIVFLPKTGAEARLKQLAEAGQMVLTASDAANQPATPLQASAAPLLQTPSRSSKPPAASPKRPAAPGKPLTRRPQDAPSQPDSQTIPGQLPLFG
jgi:DNA mismatch repair protein MutS